MSSILVPVADETCRAAVEEYVRALQQAGLNVRLEDARTDFELGDEISVWLTWPQHDDDLPVDPEDAEAEPEDQEPACDFVVPCIAGLYLRTVRFLAAHRRPAAAWLGATANK
jgi:hypothetical protein